MTTLATMESRIKRELGRAASPDENQALRDAIISAVDGHKSDRFQFNEGRFSFQTVSGQHEYTSFTRADGITALPSSEVFEVDWLRHEHNGARRHLEPTTSQRLDQYGSSYTGTPTGWSWFGSSLLLTPTPDNNSTVTGWGILELDDDNNAGQLLGSASNGTFTNSWFTEGERLVRFQALAYLFEMVYDNTRRADRSYQLAALEKDNLRVRGQRMTSPQDRTVFTI